MTTLTMERSGQVSLPGGVRSRYRLSPDVPLRLVEARAGILLVPLTEGAVGEELARELEEWQSVGMEAWDMFPYEDVGHERR